MLAHLLDKLPHKAPALLLSSVEKADEHGCVCRLIDAPDPSLAPDGLLPAPLALEAIAQAAAVWMAWSNADSPAQGMLVQCRDFVMNKRRLRISDGLIATARPLSVGSATGLNLFSGSVSGPSGELLATATLMIHTRKAES